MEHTSRRARPHRMRTLRIDDDYDHARRGRGRATCRASRSWLAGVRDVLDIAEIDGASACSVVSSLCKQAPYGIQKQSGSLLALSPPYVALVLLGVTGQSPNLVAHPIRRVRELPDRRN